MFGAGDPIDSLEEEQSATSLVPSTAGQVAGAVFGQAISDLPSVGLARVAGRLGTTYGISTDETGPNGEPVFDPANAEPAAPKDQLNKQYGIPGVLSFDKDMPASIASDLYDHHVAEIQRNDILARNQGGLLQGGVARFVEGTATSMLDPLNIAALFVPGVPEARVAGVLGEAAEGAAGRALVRGITGASQGVAGTAALLPAEAVVKQSDQDDWDMGQALSQLAFGAVAGGVLHAGLGAAEDLHGPLPAWSQRLAQQPPEIQDAMARGALSAISEDRPVNVASTMDTHDALNAQQELVTWAGQQSRIDDEFSANEQQSTEAAQSLGTQRAQLQGGMDATADHIEGLRAQAEGIRNDQGALPPSPGDADPATQDRLASIDAELQQPIPGSRRLDLQSERTMLTEGAPQPGDLEVLRDAQQAQALQAAGQRVNQRLQDAQARIENLKQSGVDLEEQAANNARQTRINDVRTQSKEGVVRDLTARTIRRFAGRRGVELGDGEAEASARDILSAKPSETKGKIQDVLNDIGDRGKRGAEPIPAGVEVPTIGGGLNDLSRVATEAGDAMTAGKRGPRPLTDQDLSVQRENTAREATAPKVEGGGQTLADQAAADADNARLDALIDGERKAGRWTEADDKALSNIKDQQALGEGDAAAYQEAAACLAANMGRG